MKGKSRAYQLIATLVLIVGAYMSNFSENIQVWLGAFVAIGTMLLASPLLSSGAWPKGWNWVTYSLNIGAILIQAGAYLGEHALVNPAILNGVMIGINLFLSTWVKDYATVDPAQAKLI